MSENHLFHDNTNEYDAHYLMCAFLDEFLQEIAYRKTFLSNIGLLSYIQKRLSYLRDLTSHFFFLNYHDMLCSIDRRILDFSVLQLSPRLKISAYVELLQQFYLECNEHSIGVDKNISFILFSRNSRSYISGYSHIVRVEEDTFSQYQHLRVHQLTRGDMPAYIIFLPGRQDMVLNADRLHHRIRSKREDYIEASLLPLRHKTNSIRGKFRYRGSWYYAIDNRYQPFPQV